MSKKKNKKKVINKSVKTTTKKTEPVSVKKEAVDKK